MLVGNRVGVTLAHLFLFKVPTTGVKKTVLMVETPLWRGLGIFGFNQDDEPYLPGWLLLTNPVTPPLLA